MLERPMLAAKTTDSDLQRLRYPLLLSPKIDGIRALGRDGKLLSRSMKLIPNQHVQRYFGQHGLHGLDGELVCGNPYDRNLMQKTTSAVMTHTGTPDVTWWVFDFWPYPDKPFHERIKMVSSIVDYWETVTDSDIKVRPLTHELISSYDELLEREQYYLGLGYEGVMLRKLDGPYKQNRSTVREGWLLKVKRFTDAEAEVVDYEPLYRNLNAQVRDERGYAKRSTHQDNRVADELLGSLIVRCKVSGVTFSVGSGFTESQRVELWDRRHTLPGRIVKYKCFNVTGVKDKPRFPIFVGFRDPLDM